MHIRIATRRSPLAIWQAEYVAAQLQALQPDITVELIKIVSQGDKILDVPLAKIGGKGLFTKEIDQALIDGTADIAVHSMKDVPTELPHGMLIAAIPEREDPRDVVMTASGGGLSTLPAGARIGSSSLRRMSQIKRHYPHLVCVPIRGSVQTRLNKLHHDVDAVMLAYAGVKRLGLLHHVSEIMEVTQILPAVGQGALAIQSHAHAHSLNALLARMSHADTMDSITAERAFLTTLNGGCQVPIAAYARIEQQQLVITGYIGDVDTPTFVEDALRGQRTEAHALGVTLAQRLLDRGAKAILQKVYARPTPHP